MVMVIIVCVHTHPHTQATGDMDTIAMFEYLLELKRTIEVNSVLLP